MKVEVVSPESITFTGEADMVVARTVGGGDIAFQAGHVPFIGVLQVHEAKIVDGEGVELFAVHSGFIQTAHDKVTILSDISERKDDIDVNRARSALERAEAALAASEEPPWAEPAKERAVVRLRVASGESTLEGG